MCRFYLKSFGSGFEVGEKSTLLVQLIDYSLVLFPQFLPDQIVIKILFFWLWTFEIFFAHKLNVPRIDGFRVLKLHHFVFLSWNWISPCPSSVFLANLSQLIDMPLDIRVDHPLLEVSELVHTLLGSVLSSINSLTFMTSGDLWSLS